MTLCCDPRPRWFLLDSLRNRQPGKDILPKASVVLVPWEWRVIRRSATRCAADRHHRVVHQDSEKTILLEPAF
jgi:hypothetical protein